MIGDSSRSPTRATSPRSAEKNHAGCATIRTWRLTGIRGAIAVTATCMKRRTLLTMCSTWIRWAEATAAPCAIPRTSLAGRGTPPWPAGSAMATWSLPVRSCRPSNAGWSESRRAMSTRCTACAFGATANSPSGSRRNTPHFDRCDVCHREFLDTDHRRMAPYVPMPAPGMSRPQQ